MLNKLDQYSLMKRINIPNPKDYFQELAIINHNIVAILVNEKFNILKSRLLIYKVSGTEIRLF
jgi:hypothetical protein